MEQGARFGSLSARVALVVILASLPVLASCGVSAGDGLRAAEARSAADQTMNQRSVQVSVSEGDVVARAGDAEARAGQGAVARAGDVVARAGAGAFARAGDVEARARTGEDAQGTDADSEGSSRKVVLEIRGEHGTRFSGKCSIGGEERRFDGRVPESYHYELGGKKLECEIRKDGPGTLEVALASGNDVHSVQRQSGTGNSVIHLSYSGDGASGVTSSQSQVSSTSDSSTKSR